MPPETSKYFSIFVLASLLPKLLASDPPVGPPALSPSYVSFASSSDVVPAPATGSGETLPSTSDGSISAPPLSSSIAPSSGLSEASSSLESNSSDLSPSPAPGNVIGAPESTRSFPPNAEAQAPELVIVNGGEDMSSQEPPYVAHPPYTEPQRVPLPSASALNGGGEGNFMALDNANPKVLPFEYRAEDEPVDPYPGEETHGRFNGAVAGTMVSVGVVGLAGFVYHKKRSKNVRAQYQSLGRNNVKKSFSL